MVEVIAFACNGVAVISFLILWQRAEKRLRFSLKTIAEFKAKIDAIRETAESITKETLTSRYEKAQDIPQKLNAAGARRRMEGVNREYFSADRKRTNSEVLKED